METLVKLVLEYEQCVTDTSQCSNMILSSGKSDKAAVLMKRMHDKQAEMISYAKELKDGKTS